MVSDRRARRLEEGMTRTASIQVNCICHTNNATMTNSKWVEMICNTRLHGVAGRVASGVMAPARSKT